MTVEAPRSTDHRTLDDVVRILQPLDTSLRSDAVRVFERLAAAEAAVHGVPIDQVHFHEVGALDAIADIVGVVTALDDLGIERLACSPIALGGGRAATDHGSIPIPGPAVLALLADSDATGFGGPVDVELATPTGVALATALAHEHGPMPPLVVDAVGVGAGTRDLAGHPNITRLVIGDAVDAIDPNGPPGVTRQVVIETNVDDLDPRLWPDVLATLMDAGAADAWLTPILMKKGRPAHTLRVLCEPTYVDALSHIVFTHTTAIGLRHFPVSKVALPRETVTVDVLGHPVSVKISRLDGEIVQSTPEYDDVVGVARALDRPTSEVLEAATAATRSWPPS